jgi:hypothetical protein
VIPPSQTAYDVNLSNPNFPSTGRLPNQWKEFQPRVGVAWDVRGNGKSVLRASWGIFNARQNMLTQTDAIAVNGVQQSAVNGLPTYPGTLPLPVLQPGQFQPGVGVFVFSKDYANPRIYTTSVGYERQIAGDYAAYADFVLSKGVHLTRFINPNVGSTVTIPENGDTVSYSGPVPFPNLGVVTVTASSAKSLYRGLTIGLRKRLGHRFMFDGNYTYSVDKDDDSNERDPFTFRYANLFKLADEYANSDRDERHRFNFYTVTNLPWGLNGTVRMQAHSAEPHHRRAGLDSKRAAVQHYELEHALRRWRRLRSQPFAQGQRFLHVRFRNRQAYPPRRAIPNRPEDRDVQHLQQHQQRQSLVVTGVV